MATASFINTFTDMSINSDTTEGVTFTKDQLQEWAKNAAEAGAPPTLARLDTANGNARVVPRSHRIRMALRHVLAALDPPQRYGGIVECSSRTSVIIQSQFGIGN